MAGMMTGPVAATSATAEPEISAKNMDCTMFTCARPPRMKPTIAIARSISRCVIEDEFMIAPARMNIGIASSGKLVAPSNITSARFGSIWAPCVIQIAATAIDAERDRDRYVEHHQRRQRDDHEVAWRRSLAVDLLGRPRSRHVRSSASLISWSSSGPRRASSSASGKRSSSAMTNSTRGDRNHRRDPLLLQPRKRHQREPGRSPARPDSP